MRVRVRGFVSVCVGVAFLIVVPHAVSQGPGTLPPDTTPPVLDLDIAHYQSSPKHLTATASCDEPCGVRLQARLVLPKGYFDNLPKGSDTRRRRDFEDFSFLPTAGVERKVGLAYGAESNTPTILKRVFRAEDAARMKLTIVVNDTAGNNGSIPHNTATYKHKIKLGPPR